MDTPNYRWQWIGSDEPHLDEPFVYTRGRMTLGVYGGNSYAGANKNEDGALAWSDANGEWEFSMIIDGHNTSDSVRLLLDTMEAHRNDIQSILYESVSQAFKHLQQHLFDILSAVDSRSVRGESSCLIVVRKENYLWWLNIGDCLLYVFHSDYAKLGQYAVNQRSFFEWIGEVNSFSETVPCYTTGIKRLRQGRNVILAVTDGVLECGNRPFESPKVLYETIYSSPSLESKIRDILKTVNAERGTDSATAVAWSYDCDKVGPFPSS